MTKFRVLDGERDKLERKLLKELFAPRPSGPETRQLLEKLKPRGKLTLISAPDGPAKLVPIELEEQGDKQ